MLQNHIKTVGEALQSVEQQLADAGVYLGHGTDNYWDEAVQLVLFALAKPLDSHVSILDEVISDQDRHKIETILKRRIEQRVPLPYLTDQAWFAGLCFFITPSVLIPRSPLAELIEKQFVPWCTHSPEQVLDLCCGSGCIGIACAVYMPECQVDIADISAEALVVAQQNIDQFELEDRVACFQSDLFASLPEKQYDLIVCNPPYVDAEDMARLPEEYLHEPRLALAAGEDGLDLVKEILRQASQYLNNNGVLIVEVGNSWEALEARYPTVPFIWLEFERGGHGVFLLSKAQLEEFQHHFHV